MTPWEIAGVALAVLVVFAGWAFHWWVLGWWEWPLVGPEWRAERERQWFDRHDMEEVEPGMWEKRTCDCGEMQYCEVCWPVGDPPWVQAARDEFDRDWADQLHDINTALREDLEEVPPGGHPIYADLSDDPDLIVWDAQQQAQRCWEIVHIEFPRLRTQLLAEYPVAA